MLYLSSFLTLAGCLHDTSDTSACKFNGFIFLYVPSIYVSILRHLSPESFHKLKPISFFIASQRPLVTFSVTHYCLNCKPANTAVSPRFSPVISQVSCIKVTVDKTVEFSMSLVYCVVQGNDPTQFLLLSLPVI